jgi:hypothetical protein
MKCLLVVGSFITPLRSAMTVTGLPSATNFPVCDSYRMYSVIQDTIPNSVYLTPSTMNYIQVQFDFRADDKN